MNHKIILLLAIAFAAALRVPGLDYPLVHNEYDWGLNVVSFMQGSSYLTQYIPHPPLASMGYLLSISAVGFSAFAMRLMPFAVGIAMIVLMYIFVRDVYGSRAAIFSAIMTAVLFSSVWTSLYVDVDGNLLSLFVGLTLYCCYKFTQEGGRKWLLISGLSFGLALLSKYPAVLALPVMLLADFYGHRLKNLKGILLIAAIGVAVFSVFPIWSFATGNGETFIATLEWGTRSVGERAAFTPGGIASSSAKTIVFLFQYATPAIPLLALLAISRKAKKQNSVFLSWAAVYLVFYALIFIGGSKARYISVAIPPLVALSSAFVAGVYAKVRRRDWINFAAVFAISLLIIIALNSYGTGGNFNQHTASLNALAGNALFWFPGFASSPFAIRIQSFVFAAAASLVLFMAGLKLPARLRGITLIMLAISLSFSSFATFQSYYPTVGPDYRQTYHEMLAYIDSTSLKEPIYAQTEGFNLFSKKAVLTSPLQGISGTVILMDLQTFDDPALEEFEGFLKNECTQKKTFNSNGFMFGYVFEC